MELLVFLALGILGLPFILSIVAMARTQRVAELQSKVLDLESRVHELSATLARLMERAAAETPAPPSPEQKPVPEHAHRFIPEATSDEELVELVEPVAAPVADMAAADSSDAPVREASLQIDRQTAAYEIRAEKPEETTEPEEEVAVEVAASEIAADPDSIPRPQRNLEELLGGQLFLKAGVGIVVIGVVFFLAYAMAQMGALGRVLVGLLLGGFGFAGGFVLERREKYRHFGRSILAGSTAILFFVVFAAHYLPAARIIDSALIGNLLIFLTALGVVVFSLRYNHEWTTAAAFLLVFLSLIFAAIHADVIFNLTAIDFVAVGIAVLALKKSWWRLLSLGIAATWITLCVWIVPNVTETPTGWFAVALLLGSTLMPWACFQVASIRAVPGSDRFEKWLIAAYLANAAGGFGLTLFEVNELGSEHSWLVAIFFGAAYILGGWRLSIRNRRTLYLVSATIGLGALALVSPLRLGLGHRAIPLARMIGIEVLLTAGIFLKERYFRSLAYAAFVFTFAEILFTKLDASPVDLVGFTFPFRILLLSGMTAVAIFNTYLCRTTWHKTLGAWEVPGVAYAFSSAAALALAALCWLDFPRYWEGVALAALTLTWTVVAWRKSLNDFLVQSALLFAAAGITAFNQNLAASGPSRWLTIACCSAPLLIAHYFLELFLCRTEGEGPLEREWGDQVGHEIISGVLLVLPVSLLAAMVKLEMMVHGLNLLVAPLWGLAGVLLIERGRFNKIWTWAVAGTALFLAGLLHLFLVNIVQPGEIWHMSYRSLTCLPFAGLAVYLHLSWRGSVASLSISDRAKNAVDSARYIFFHAVSVTLAAFFLYELPRSYVAVAWALMACVLVARWTKTLDPHWRMLAFVMGLATVVRVFGANLYFRDETAFVRHNVVAIPIACLLLMMAYAFVYRLRLRLGSDSKSADDARRPWFTAANRHIWFFGTVSILTAFLWIEAQGTALTIWLSIEALSIVVAGFGLKERPVRLTGLALLIFCIAKLFAYDLAGLTGLARVFSFVCLGIVLIAVSFVYTKFRGRMKAIL